MKRIFILIPALLFTISLQAQQYSLLDLETRFIENNSALIASRFNIDRAEALIIQEKVWQNPNFTISEVNLWKNKGAEELPILFGNYGKHQQFSLELEQLIETAGKRKKRVSLKRLEKNNASFEYEELIRELKKEIRTSYYSLERIQKEEKELFRMLSLFEQMNEQYKRQSSLNNVRKVDYYRIQTELMGLQKEQRELEEDKFEALKNLRVLTNLTELEIDQIDYNSTKLPNSRLLPYDILELAKEQNIGLLRQNNEILMAQNSYELELAERVPNVALQLGYDRGGNIMRDFVGIGASVDIPIFNKNKGNIAAAKYQLKQQNALRQDIELSLSQTIRSLENQFRRLETTLSTWSANDLEDQVKVVQSYSKHLLNKEVTLMEFIDFVQSYREAYQAYIQTQEKYHQVFEELQYIVGKDF